MTALRLLRGHSPQGYLRGVPLDTPFVSFLVKGKIPRCGARSSTKGKFTETLVQSKVYNLSFFSSNESFINLFVLWARAAHTGTDFSFTRKVSKSVSKRRCPLGNLLRGKYPPQSLRDAPPLIHQTFMISVGGSVTACGYCGGKAPRGDLKEDTSSLIRFWILFS